MKNKRVKAAAVLAALGLSLGIAACNFGGGTSDSSSASGGAVSSSSNVEANDKTGDYTAASWSALVALTKFENCTVDITVAFENGSQIAKYLFSADGYSANVKSTWLGDVGVSGGGPTDVDYATEDATETADKRREVLGFLQEMRFENVRYDSASKTYRLDGEFFAAGGSVYKDATVKVKNGEIVQVGMTEIKDGVTRTHAYAFSKYNTTTPDLPSE